MDEEEGLDVLIAQRSQRPSYARMISWEFDDAEEPMVVSMQRRRRRRSKQQSGETNEHTADLDPELRSGVSSLSLKSDSDEEFFSAEEWLISDSESVTENSIVSERSDGVQELTGAECESDENSVFSDENTSLTTSSSNIRSSRLSKKQKKKRRKEMSTMYENQIRPFMDLEFDDIEHILPDQPSVDRMLDLSKDVPSLVQLCIRSSYKLNFKLMPELPNKLKRLFHVDDDFSLQKIQLSWLHSTLARFEPKEKFTENCMFKMNPDRPVLLHPVRNVCNKTSSVNHTDHTVLATLPLTSIDWTDPNLEQRRAISTWAVVAATLELMMPPFLSASAYRHQSESEDDRIVRATRSLMTRLKFAMKSRFPTVVSHCFDDAVPYALWARGDIHQATEYFKSLSQSTDNKALKAVYHNEVGHMHAMIGATETAAKFYRLSSDILLKDVKNSLCADNITTNMLLLVANLYDQGIFTPQKGKQSAHAWNVVLTSKYSQKVEGLERHIMDSYLCTHCGSVQGIEWLEQAKSMLTDLSTSDPELVYYLSMVHALLGEEKQAHTVYMEYVKMLGENSFEAAGREIVSLSGKGAKCNPWKPLVTMVKELDNNVNFLPVIWRVQLGHLKISTGKGLESDICSKTLDLHFDNNGYLTGNMQMYLPPIRGIQINPYTGALHFNQHKSPTKVLTTWDCNSDQKYITAGTFVIPTLLEIYNKDGVKVHIMLGRKAGNLNNINKNFLDMATLIWTGPDGQKARLNIYKKFREHCIKDANDKIEEILKTKLKDKDFQHEDGKKFLRLCIDKYRVVDYKWLKTSMDNLSYTRKQFVLNEERREKLLQRQYEPKGKGNRFKPADVKFSYTKAPTLKLDYYAHPDVYALNLTNLTVVGNTLTFFTRQNSSTSQYVWAIDLTSKESFLACKDMPVAYTNYKFISLPVRNKIRHTIPDATILLDHTGTPGFTVMGVKHLGEQRVSVTCPRTDTSTCADIQRMFIFGSQLIGISYNSRIWSWDNKNGQREVGEAFTRVRDLDLIGNVLVVSMEKGIQFCSVPCDNDHVFAPLPVTLSSQFQGTELTLNNEGTVISTSRIKIKVTGTQKELRDGKEMYRAAISLDNIAVVMLVPADVYGPRDSVSPIEILLAVTLPGHGTETCFISQQDGMLMGWSQHNEDSMHYREHIFQVDYEARLRSILPFLGYGPRSLLPVFLPGDPDIQAKHPGHGQPGWYVFMRDGYEGIIGVKLVH
ncbi:uncharacterized protein LOC132562768 [Ylistrum balloti]|uniref:uncharacterized protein LOC132562768 n=1 Tax=Ylistrum balloti TaxID=509963 RepID=UPI002905ECC0|nr:uncharacterized protein LOC132562768 [Ylistrum balloti]